MLCFRTVRTAVFMGVLGCCFSAGAADRETAISNASAFVVMGPVRESPLDAYTVEETQRVFQEHLNLDIQELNAATEERPRQNRVVIGTAQNNPRIAELLKNGFLNAESHEQGYSMRCAPHPQNPKVWLLAIAGADSRGALYGLRDLEHYELKRFVVKGGKLEPRAFARHDYPRIEYRGHWVWGCNMPDKKAWLENMSRWKLNELIHWDNYPPEKAKDYVDFAHSRGIRVVWGFGWGWNPDWNFTVPKEFDRGVGKGVLMCGSDEFNLAFFKREILRKIRDEYVPSGCDGVYFQSFTEGPKCQCEKCKNKSMGKIMLEFVNPLVDAIKKEFPDLWISCGIHANFGVYDELKELDPRCNIYWENCPSGVSVRGDHEDFGYINKTLPYAHGFSKTCPADPEYTEASLQEWMQSNAHRYALQGDRTAYYNYMKGHQAWGKAMLGKPSTDKHGTTVACHSVFCRRTPYLHVALAEAMWNPNLETEETVDGIIAFLSANGGLPGFSGASSGKSASTAQHDAVGKKLMLATPYHAKYTGGGDNALTDGRRVGAANAADRAWQGYEKQNLDAVVDLEKPMSINGLSVGFLHQPRAGVHLPKEVEFAISRDGKTFDVIKVVPNRLTEADASRDHRKSYRVDGLDLYQVRYVRIRAKYVRHWLMADEIMVNPLALEETSADEATTEGWSSLFDGKTLAGWTPTPGGKWEVRDGVIVGTSPRTEKRHGILLSDRKYSDFKIRFQYRSVKGNSGLYFRSERVQTDVGLAGFQAEINPEGEDAGGLYETEGRLWVVKPSSEVVAGAFKPGEWNKMSVEAIGGNVVVRLNGRKTAELKDDKGRLHGHFGLQLHGGEEMHVEFKDIEIRDLSANDRERDRKKSRCK